MKKIDMLHASWSKRANDLNLHWPCGVSTKSDAHWLCGILNENVLAELDRRGYDLTTIKFSIEPKKGNQRFASQRNENQG